MPVVDPADAAGDLNKHKNGRSEPVANWKIHGKSPSYNTDMGNMKILLQDSDHPFQIDH